MPRSETIILVDTVDTHFEKHPDDLHAKDLRRLGADILAETNDEIQLRNAVVDKSERWPKRKALTPAAIARILLKTRILRAVNLCAESRKEAELDSSTEPVLALYDPEEGIYKIASREIERDILEIEANLDLNGQKQVLKILLTMAPLAVRTGDPDLIPVNNGVFNYKTKELLPFSPDFVFLAKSPVNYVPFPANPVIRNPDDGTDWDVESWMSDLSDDPEVVLLLWQILGACIRPGVSWDKVALLYSTVGSNGKGTFCELARGLCGSGHASLAIADFEKDFALEKLVSATAVIADENNVGAHIDKSANFKAAATGDMLHVNRKYKIPITYRFRGFIIQCVNELPKVKDKSESFNRRLLCVPFEKSFRGAERKYIKHDYLHRKDILEYVLYKILHMDYDELSEPEACKNLLHEYRTNNNPVLDFAEEMLPELKWDFVPFTFLYDLFKAWFRQTNPSGIVVGYKTFLFGLLNALAAENLGWYCQDKNQAVRPGNRMDAPEPLILEYDLEDWKNPMYKGGNPDMICRPILKPNYRGILRGPSPSAFHAACADIPENPFT